MNIGRLRRNDARWRTRWSRIRKVTALLALVWAVSGLAFRGVCAPTLQFHCAGLAALKADANLASLHEVMTNRATEEMKRLAAQRLAQVASDYLQIHTNASFLTALFTNAMETECAGICFPHEGFSSLILALRADDRRAQRCREIIEKSPSPFVWNRRDHDWLLIGCGQRPGTNQKFSVASLIASLPAGRGPAGPWMTAEFNDMLPFVKSCRVHLTISVANKDLETRAQITFPNELQWHRTPWRLPKSLVHDPLVSFTAGQDVGAFLNAPLLVGGIADNPLTNQFCAWAMGQMPLQTYMAWPAINTNVLHTVAPELTNRIGPELGAYNGTSLVWLTNYHRLVWSKMRVLAPQLEVMDQSEGPFCLLSFFPFGPAFRHPSADLWTQLESQTNLVYYDWEITAQRLQQWRLLWGVLSFRPVEAAGEGEDLSAVRQTWLSAFTPRPERTVTEITRSDDKDLVFVRRGPVGLSSVEWAVLSDWVCRGPAFAEVPKRRP